MAQSLARRTSVQVLFAGKDITEDIKPYFSALEYTDNEDGETDDLQVRLIDRSGKWQNEWLAQVLSAAASSSNRLNPELAGLMMEAYILRHNWEEDGKTVRLDCGRFYLDEVKSSGPPRSVTLKGSSLPYRSTLRQAPATRHYSQTSLSAIAQTVASRGGLEFSNLLVSNPSIRAADQNNETDVAFLHRLCGTYDVMMKITASAIVLYNGFSSVVGGSVTLRPEDLGQYDLNVGRAQREYSSCRVSYVKPGGTVVSGVAYTEDYDANNENNLQLELTIRCQDNAEAKRIAEYQLERHNRYAFTGSLTMAGDPRIVSGITVRLADFGLWNGDYAVTCAKHNVDASGGYKTTAELRRLG